MSRLNELFPAGPPIDEEMQVGRGPVIDGLVARMRDAEKLKLLEPRRTGKSSVAGAVIERLRVALLPAAGVDLASLTGPTAAVEVLRAQLSAALAKARRATGWLADRLQGGLRGDDKILAGIFAELAAGGSGPAAVLAHAAEAAQGEPIAVIIDEAHHVASWPDGEQQALREFLRNDTTVGVIVASSETSALARLTGDDGPLRYVGQRFRLPPIDRGDWEHELPPRFEAAGVPISRDALTLLLDEARLQPYCTMLLAREAARVRTIGRSGHRCHRQGRPAHGRGGRGLGAS